MKGCIATFDRRTGTPAWPVRTVFIILKNMLHRRGLESHVRTSEGTFEKMASCWRKNLHTMKIMMLYYKEEEDRIEQLLLMYYLPKCCVEG